MSDFDPKDVLATAPPPASDFDDKDVLRLMPGSDFEEQDIISAQPEDKAPKYLSDADFQRIGQKYGVDASKLKSIAPYYDVNIQSQSLGEAASVGAKAVAGTVARIPFLGAPVPQAVYQEFQDDKTKQAINELIGISREQQTPLDIAREIAMPGSAIGAAAKSTAARIGGAIATGGLMGAADAKSGERTQGVITGAAIGGALGGTLEGLGKALGKMSKAEQSLLSDPRNRQIDLQEISNQANQKYARSEAVLEESVFSRLERDRLSQQDVDALLKEQYGDDALQRLLDPSTSEGEAIRRGIGASDANRSSVYDKLINQTLDNRARDFAEDLTGVRPEGRLEAEKMINEQMGRQGADYVQSRYKDYVNTLNTAREIENQGIRATGSVLDKPIEKISGDQFVLREYDDRYGTRLEKALSELNRDTNRLTFIKGAKRQAIDGLFKEARSVGRDASLVNGQAIIRAIESGKVDSLDSEDLKLAQRIMDEFAATRKFANESVKDFEKGRIQAMAIPKVENYVSRMSVDIPEMVVRVEKKLDELKLQLSKSLGKPIKDLAQVSKGELVKVGNPTELKDLIDFISWKEGKVFVPRSGAELSNKLKDMIYTQDGNIALERVARSALSRSEATPMPGFIREVNLYKILDKYNNDVLTSLYKRRGLDMLRNEAQKLRKVGAEGQAAYVERIIQDTLGTRKGTAAAVFGDIRREIARALNVRIENASSDVTRNALEMIKSTPDMLSFLHRQLYPNVLGWLNPRPIIQNMLSGIARTAPELGTEYGYTTYLRGVTNAVMNFNKLSEEAKSLGMIPDEFIRAGERALGEGIRRSGVVDRSIGGYEKLAKYGMALYQMSENFNRASILGTAKVMASDLARNSQLAQSGLKRFPFEVRKEILANKTNPEKNYEIIAKYLNDVTAFNYNRQSMFELGRELGPIFAQFAKWPTEVAGEAIYDLRSKGAIKGLGRMAERLLLPVSAFLAIDFLVNEAGKDTDTYKKIVGSSGLSAAAPANALIGFTSGDIFTPPAVDVLMKGLVTPVMKGDLPALGKGLDSLAFNYLPGAGALKRLTEDLATFVEGSRPSGSTTTERVIEGAEALTK